MADRSSPASLVGLLAVGLGVCCGLPVLASVGLLGAVAGLSAGSWVLVAAGVAAVAVGAWRWWRPGICEQRSDGDRPDTSPVPTPGSAACAPRERGGTPR